VSARLFRRQVACDNRGGHCAHGDEAVIKMSNPHRRTAAGQTSKRDIAGDDDIDKAIGRLSKEMKDAAKNLDFERAAEIRGKLRELKEARIFV
jgi:excinuclease UvrABC helicase subunit UvrB